MFYLRKTRPETQSMKIRKIINKRQLSRLPQNPKYNCRHKKNFHDEQSRLVKLKIAGVIQNSERTTLKITYKNQFYNMANKLTKHKQTKQTIGRHFL